MQCSSQCHDGQWRATSQPAQAASKGLFNLAALAQQVQAVQSTTLPTHTAHALLSLICRLAGTVRSSPAYHTPAHTHTHAFTSTKQGWGWVGAEADRKTVVNSALKCRDLVLGVRAKSKRPSLPPVRGAKGHTFPPSEAQKSNKKEEEKKVQIFVLAFVVLGAGQLGHTGEEKSALGGAARAAQVQTFPRG